VVQNGQLAQVSATFNPATGDTTVAGTAFSTAHPATAPNYAANESWFIQSDSVTFNNTQYVKYGVARNVTPNMLTSAGSVNGIPVFAESSAQEPYQVLYVPIRPGCEFQPYQVREALRPRG